MRLISCICLAAITAMNCPLALCQAWSVPLRFRATNATVGVQWAVVGDFQGEVSSDGKTVEVSVERITLSRPESLPWPVELLNLDASVTRTGPNGQWRRMKISPPLVLHRTLKSGETVSLDPFRLQITLGDFSPIKGDYLTFALVNTGTYNGKPSTGTVYVQMRTPLPVAQVAAAYCADEITRLAKLPGGADAYQVIGFCQDATGLTRRAHIYRPPGGGADVLSSTEIFDPVKSINWILDHRNKVAYRSKAYQGGIMGGIIGGLPSTAPPPPPGSAPAGPPVLPLKPVTTTKWLGRKLVEGIEAEGNLTTTVFPAGYQRVDHEITVTSETWFSYTIRANVSTMNRDPRNDGFDYHLENIRLGNPDAGVFEIPEDYKIVDR